MNTIYTVTRVHDVDGIHEQAAFSQEKDALQYDMYLKTLTATEGFTVTYGIIEVDSLLIKGLP